MLYTDSYATLLFASFLFCLLSIAEHASLQLGLECTLMSPLSEFKCSHESCVKKYYAPNPTQKIK